MALPNVEFVTTASGSVHVDTVGVVHVAGRVHESGESSVKVDDHFHVIVRTFGRNVCIECNAIAIESIVRRQTTEQKQAKKKGQWWLTFDSSDVHSGTTTERVSCRRETCFDFRLQLGSRRRNRSARNQTVRNDRHVWVRIRKTDRIRTWSAERRCVHVGHCQTVHNRSEIQIVVHCVDCVRTHLRSDRQRIDADRMNRIVQISSSVVGRTVVVAVRWDHAGRTGCVGRRCRNRWSKNAAVGGRRGSHVWQCRLSSGRIAKSAGNSVNGRHARRVGRSIAIINPSEAIFWTGRLYRIGTGRRAHRVVNVRMMVHRVRGRVIWPHVQFGWIQAGLWVVRIVGVGRVTFVAARLGHGCYRIRMRRGRGRRRGRRRVGQCGRSDHFRFRLSVMRSNGQKVGFDGQRRLHRRRIMNIALDCCGRRIERGACRRNGRRRRRSGRRRKGGRRRRGRGWRGRIIRQIATSGCGRASRWWLTTNVVVDHYQSGCTWVAFRFWLGSSVGRPDRFGRRERHLSGWRWRRRERWWWW